MYTRDAYLVIGRFQGYTLKHDELICVAKTDVARTICLWHPPEVMVGIVCGKETSKDRERNPFSFVDRVWMIKQCHPDLMCLKFSSAYLGDVIDLFYGLGYNLKRLYVGQDREETYAKQVKRYKYDIEIRVLMRDNSLISGTAVREALKKDDKEEFESVSPKGIHRHYEKIKTMYDENVINK